MNPGHPGVVSPPSSTSIVPGSGHGFAGFVQAVGLKQLLLLAGLFLVVIFSGVGYLYEKSTSSTGPVPNNHSTIGTSKSSGNQQAAAGVSNYSTQPSTSSQSSQPASSQGIASTPSTSSPKSSSSGSKSQTSSSGGFSSSGGSSSSGGGSSSGGSSGGGSSGGGSSGGGSSGGSTGSGVSSQGGCTYNSVLAPCVGSATTGVSGWGTPVFDEEFNGSSLNTSTWCSSWFNGGSMNNVSTSASNVSVSGGNLVLTLASSSSGALINTNPSDCGITGFTMTTGYYAEASIYFPGSGSSIYNWPAFWTDGQSWPANGEIDIAEGLGNLTAHYHSSQPTQDSNPGGTWSNGWHTYAVDRENGADYIYWDGQQVANFTPYDSSAPQYLILNVGNGHTAAYGAASQVKVNYVRVWK